MKQAIDGVFAAVLGIAVVSSGCTSPGGRFTGGVVSTIVGGGLIAAVPANHPAGCTRDNGCWFASEREALDTMGYVVGAALLAAGVALLIPDMRDRSKNPPAAATTVPGAASAAHRPIAPDREVAPAVPPVGYRM